MAMPYPTRRRSCKKTKLQLQYVQYLRYLPSRKLHTTVTLWPRNSEAVTIATNFPDSVEFNPEFQRSKVHTNDWNSNTFEFDGIRTEIASQKRCLQSLLSGNAITIGSFVRLLQLEGHQLEAIKAASKSMRLIEVGKRSVTWFLRSNWLHKGQWVGSVRVSYIGRNSMRQRLMNKEISDEYAEIEKKIVKEGLRNTVVASKEAYSFVVTLTEYLRLKLLLRFSREYVTASNNLGEAYKKKKEHKSAVRTFAEALLFDPNNKFKLQRDSSRVLFSGLSLQALESLPDERVKRMWVYS
ncbi:hypothetical protein CTI12_AA487270 [Artemisia annua]|uniref:Uncharacterized protein n=1 Tax=Artemisia annua TaxID=35608 RepID=A0A2U1LIK1_ARTAN|nr:hypothetical protein CTI12_AA487270 [Artemisia annua]